MTYIRRGKFLEEQADKFSADYAFKYSELKPHDDDDGYNEDETYRTRFRRDKDRILYSDAYRRLQNKTQVFANSVENSVRTRLTHTLEVQQLATSIADALCVNRDLAEAIAVGHDIGHTPFGHAVERELDIKMIDKGGFSHAIQSLNCLKIKKISVHDQVLEGMLKHDTEVFVKARRAELSTNQYDCTRLQPGKAGTVEAQIVFWADKIAYLSHDWEDFSMSIIFQNLIKDGILKWRMLQELWEPLLNEKGIEALIDNRLFETRDLIRTITTNLIKNSQNNLRGISSSGEVINKTEERFHHEIEKSAETDEKCRICDNTLKNAFRNGLLINFSNDMRGAFFRAKMNLIDKYFLRCSEVAKSDYRASNMMGRLFDTFVNNPDLLPSKTRRRISEEGIPKERIVVDHLSGMTDQYAERVYRELFL